MKRSNMPHLEYIFVPTGNQALKVTGTLSTTSNSVNIANGQLGVMVATHKANLPGLTWGDWMPASTSCLDVDAIKIISGTSYSSNTSVIDGWDIKRPFNESPVIHRDSVRAFSARLATTPTFHSDLFWNFDATVAADLTQYKMYIEMRSVRNDRDYGRNVDTLPITFQSPEYSSLAAITDTRAHLLANLIHKVNLQSQAVSTSPKFASRGNKPVIAFAIDISGGSGVALGTIECGDTIPVIVTSRNGVTLTNNYIADAAFVETVADWLTTSGTPLTAASTIELVNISTAGTAGTPAIDAMVVMGLDQEVAQAYDDIYSTKVRTDVELADGLRIDPLFSNLQLSAAFDGGTSGRQWRIRYDTRGFGGQYNLQLTGHLDNVIPIPTGIDETLDYSAFILDIYDVEDRLTTSQQTQKRIIIIMPTTCTCVEAGVLGTFDVADAPDDGDTIVIGSKTFENDEGDNGVGEGNVEYDGTAADLATQIEATFAGTSATVSGTVVTVRNCVNAQPTTVTALNNVLGYWLDSVREYGKGFSLNLDPNMTTLLPPDGSSDPSGMDLGTGVYFE